MRTKPKHQPNPSAPKQTQWLERSTAAMSEAEAERYCDLLDSFASQPEVRRLIVPILEAQAAPDDKRVQFESLANRLADVIDDPSMPRRAREILECAAIEFINIMDVEDSGFVRRTFAAACSNAMGVVKGC
jgi:hypothetical protein